MSGRGDLVSYVVARIVKLHWSIHLLLKKLQSVYGDNISLMVDIYLTFVSSPVSIPIIQDAKYAVIRLSLQIECGRYMIKSIMFNE